MDFAWVVDALHRGLKVTREAWRDDPPMYLYTSKTKNGKRTIMISRGSKDDQEVYFRTDAVLDITDWEEYVEPKKTAPTKSTQEDLPVWPRTTVDGYARMSKDSDVVVHDGIYRPKKKPMFGNTKLTFDENGPRMGDTMTVEEYQRMHGGAPVKDNTEFATGDLAAEDWQAHLLGLLVDSLANQISQRVAQLLQKSDVSLSKEGTNHV